MIGFWICSMVVMLYMYNILRYVMVIFFLFILMSTGLCGV